VPLSIIFYFLFSKGAANILNFLQKSK